MLSNMRATDLELLERYTRHRAEDDFTELVRRHLDLVHAAALRQVRSPQLAEEVAQSAFTDLARHAGCLAPGTIVTAWLYEVTRRTAIDVVRREARRQARERVATEMNDLHHSAADWSHIELLIDEAMHALDATDRAAVLLRYFENKSFREVGAALGTSDDAAQKRVSRALERLRDIVSRKGVNLSAGTLGVTLSANAVQAAPVGLVATISAGAVAGAGLVTAATFTSSAAVSTKAISMTLLQKALVSTGLVVAIATGVFQTRKNSALQRLNHDLEGIAATANEQLDQLRREREEAFRQAGLLRAEAQQATRDDSELLKLRNDVARLQREAKESAANAKETQAALLDALSVAPPVKTFIATAIETITWDQALVTGGWKMPDGKRALVVVTLEPMEEEKQVMIQSRILAYPEEVGERLGLAQFNLDEKDGFRTGKTQKLSVEFVNELLKFAGESAGVDLMSSPRVTTLAGRQAQTQAQQIRSLPNGDTYSTGPVIDVIPNVSADGRSVQVMFNARLSLLVPRPEPAAPPSE